MNNILIISEQKNTLENKYYKQKPAFGKKSSKFILARILAKLDKQPKLIIPGQHGIPNFQSNGFNCLNHQEVCFDFKANDDIPNFAMTAIKEMLKKTELVLFEPKHFDTLMERSLLYAYLRKIESIVLLDETSFVSDFDLLEFSDYIITLQKISGLDGRKASIFIDIQNSQIIGSHKDFELIKIQLPINFANKSKDFVQPFTAGFIFAISNGANISASIKIGVALADIANQSDNLMPNDCDTQYLNQHYDEILSSL